MIDVTPGGLDGPPIEPKTPLLVILQRVLGGIIVGIPIVLMLVAMVWAIVWLATHFPA